MKKFGKLLYLLAFAVFFSCERTNQIEIAEVKNIPSTERTISVSGSAEINLVPNDIEFQITLEEYYNRKWDAEKNRYVKTTKVDIKEIEALMFRKLKKIGINKRDIILKDVDRFSDRDDYTRNGKVIASKTFLLKLDRMDQAEKVASALEMKGVNQASISKLSHKEIERYRKQIKADALKAAKEKAQYLLDAVDEDLGEIITVSELQDFNRGYYDSGNHNRAFTAEGASNENTIELSFTIYATFKIK